MIEGREKGKMARTWHDVGLSQPSSEMMQRKTLHRRINTTPTPQNTRTSQYHVYSALGQPGNKTHVIYLHRTPCRLQQLPLAPPLHGRESHQEARATYHRGSGLLHLHNRLLQRHHPSFRLGEAGVGGSQLRGEPRNLCRRRLGCPVSHGDGRDDRRQRHWRWSQVHAE